MEGALARLLIIIMTPEALALLLLPLPRFCRRRRLSNSYAPLLTSLPCLLPLPNPTQPREPAEPHKVGSFIIMDALLKAKGGKETTMAAGAGAAVAVTVIEELLVSAWLCV